MIQVRAFDMGSGTPGDGAEFLRAGLAVAWFRPSPGLWPPRGDALRDL